MNLEVFGIINEKPAIVLDFNKSKELLRPLNENEALFSYSLNESQTIVISPKKCNFIVLQDHYNNIKDIVNQTKFKEMFGLTEINA